MPACRGEHRTEISSGRNLFLLVGSQFLWLQIGEQVLVPAFPVQARDAVRRDVASSA